MCESFVRHYKHKKALLVGGVGNGPGGGQIGAPGVPGLRPFRLHLRDSRRGDHKWQKKKIQVVQTGEARGVQRWVGGLLSVNLGWGGLALGEFYGPPSTKG